MYSYINAHSLIFEHVTQVLHVILRPFCTNWQLIK